ncbi:MAG TPA: dienelactone hydrolase family protein [Ramlibacter sp.]|jgi:dienelactone hydrolase|nr:dienelactone hydrolase family protein [Ramlibacter sp.]
MQLRALLLVLLVGTCAVHAKPREEIVDLPVTVQDGFGRTVQQSIQLTVFSDDANPRPAPVMVLNHGRAAEAADRAALGRARYPEVARFFVRQGFVVGVPTRIGYGVSLGPDVEDTGDCNRKRYAPGYAAAAQQTLAALAALRQRPDAAPDRAVILGQSFGGMTAIAVAAQNPPGVQAAINFAGGGGGNPKTRPHRPCATAQLEQLFGEYGRTARIPTLWIYSENDLHLGPDYPRQWHAAFARAGGPGEFVQYPPFRDDGHPLLTRGPEVWQPKVLEFLRAQGFNVRPEVRP